MHSLLRSFALSVNSELLRRSATDFQFPRKPNFSRFKPLRQPSLWVTSWACENADKVAGIAGIYPVFDLRTYPGLATAAPAYELTQQKLTETLSELNPIEHVSRLAQAKIPALFIHGDQDTVVPLKENSLEFQLRYQQEKSGELVTVIVAKGQGHNYWEGFFRCQELVDFTIARARDGAKQ